MPARGWQDRISGRAALVLMGAAIAALALVAASGAFASKTYAPKNCTVPSVKPKKIVIDCGDGNSYVRHIEWKKWGHQRARGRGKLTYNDCRPSCTYGTTHVYKAKVRLGKPEKTDCGGRHVRLFSRMRLRFPDKKPPHAGRWKKNTLFCAL